jgi:predicted secreted hydrolase
MSRAGTLVVVVAAASLAVFGALTPAREEASSARPSVRLGEARKPAFARALKRTAFRWPRDHGPHFEFETEWWYYTGNLQAEGGRRFGFQLTFFRRGLSPGPPPSAGLRTNQVYFAHFAVTDVAGRRHEFRERFSRGAAGLAGASAEPFRIWLEDWSADGPAEAPHLRARDGGLRLDLRLEAKKPLVLQGEDGWSPKSDEPGNASYYVSYTRMDARGSVNGVAVRGEAWFDHEWSTSALGPEAVGWDWFSLQLDDGRELMFFQIRRTDGTPEPVSSGTLVEADGARRRLRLADVRLAAAGSFRSPEKGAEYPARWRLEVPSEELVLDIEPLLPDQELRASFTYWEGAVRLAGTSRGRPLAGQGFVELTGYARSMQGVF